MGMTRDRFINERAYRLTIFSIGTVCPPRMNRCATRDALIVGLAVPTKKTRTK